MAVKLTERKDYLLAVMTDQKTLAWLAVEKVVRMVVNMAATLVVGSAN
jgi:hypothetical protein